VKPRVAAILSADADGFGSLASRDEALAERVRAEGRAAFEAGIASRGGKLVAAPPGAVLAAFANALDAVLCATAVQAELEGRNAARAPDRRLRWRVGVAFGEIEGGDDALAGEAVEAAALMEMLSAPGGVCVSAAVYEQTAGKSELRFEPMSDSELASSPWRGFRSAPRAPERARR
jgi:class 3 adenylate cyclase